MSGAPWSWSKLGDVDPTELVGTRLDLHWAAQLPAAAGSTLLPLRVDASQTNLGWVESLGVLAGEPIDVGGSPKRAGLRLRDIALVIVAANDTIASELPLTGKTLDEGLAWLAKELGAAKVERPKHDLPEHLIGTGATFGAAGASHEEMARWFSNAHHAITNAARERTNASPVRCWPHHFDIASLVKLDADRSIGLGMSPGDASYAEPYFYVTPWPYPPPEMTLPALRGVRWHTKGWTGAVLPGSRLIVADSQERAVVDMLREGYEASIGLITPPSVR